MTASTDAGGEREGGGELRRAGAELDTSTLDALVTRLERAAEQLRTGDLSPDAAATLVEDCAGLASQASAELERMARAAQHEPIPGQDSLL
ncbi:MAG TPA: hypothetical protein VKB54_17460 [Solirubrobacteraceae bacterium]|nr:hypothetical protein [Solirubrobacteraceae bacterium]